MLVTIPEEQLEQIQNVLLRIEGIINKKERSEEGLLSVTQTMELFGCSRATLSNWRKKGILRPQLIEGKMYYIKSDCLKALQGYPTLKKGGKRNG